MQKIILPCLIVSFFLTSFNSVHAQAPDLGAASTFALFTAAGAFNGDPATSVVGDIGTNVGAFTPPGFLIGAIHNADPVSAQAAADAAGAYSFLAGLTCGSVLVTPLGNSQTLAPNIYCIGTAAVLNADLILDGGGDPGAIFIFQIDGALSTNPFSNIVLVNGANLCNVYWQINGALNVGENTLFQGTVLAEGAINLANGAILNGRGLSTAGAISTSANVVSLPSACFCTLDVTCPTSPGSNFQCIDDIPAGASTDITVNSACGATEVAIAETVSGAGCSNSPYTLTRTYTVSDDGGHFAECIVTYTAVDNIAPIITCPTVVASVECSVTPTFPAATATDNCGGIPTISFLDAITPGGLCAQEYSITRTWTATDDCGNIAQCNRTISITDNTVPVITCPTVMATLECSEVANFLVASATDLCDGNPSITFSDVNTPGGLCPQEFTLTRTWTATDDCGNTSSCSRTISVTDNTAPVLVCPIVAASIECPATPTFPAATASDLCDPSPQVTFTDASTPGLCPQEYSVTRTWTATDDCGNVSQCNRTIFVTDNTAPVLVCPTVAASIECPAIPIFPAATVSDLCDASPLLTFTDASTPGLCPQEYSITRTWTATDDCGNVSQCNRTIFVTDNTVPILVCPLVTASIECPAIPTFPAATASDLCDASPLVTFTEVSTPGLCAQEYSITRTWTATDDCGNAVQCNRTISVTDNTAPIFNNPPPNIQVECNLIPTAALLPIATDNCSPIAPVVLLSEIQNPGVCPALYTLTRTWRATDDCGNTSTISQVITVLDTQAPVFIQIPIDVVLECDLATNPDAFQDWLDTHGGALVSDCSLITWTYTDSPIFIMPSDCGGTYLRYIRFIATDECGNSSFRDASFRVQDMTPPSFNVLPQNLMVECIDGDQGEGVLPDWLENFGYAEVSDNCGEVTTQVVLVSKVLGCGNTFVSTYQFRASDECGNSSVVTAIFAIVDTTPPVIVHCPEGNVLLTCEFSIPAPDTAGLVAYDECSPVTISLQDSFSVGVGCALTKSYTYAVSDDCGNISTCYQSFQVVDSIPPVYTGPDTIAVLCVADLPGIGEIAGILAPYFSDNCYDIICVNEGVALSGVNWVTYCIKAKDLCVNWTEKFFVTFIATGGCKPLCSAPQTTWGNSGASINGMPATSAIEQLIQKYGAIKAGKLGKTISVTNAACLETMLPGTGVTTQLASGIHAFGFDNQCNAGDPMLNIDGTLNNKLVANVLALQLNVWYNQEFNERDMGVQAMSSLPPCLVETIVLNKLEENHANVQGLLNLSNDYLAGVGFFPPNFGNPLNNAVENVNNYWQNCQLNDPCTGSASIAGSLKTETLDGLEEVKVKLEGSNNSGPMPALNALTDGAGFYQFTDALPMLGHYRVTPDAAEMGYLNGVTTYDLVLISKHILGWEPLNSPYKMIAADANRSGSITTFDIVEFRKLILGIYDKLPSNQSWRFVDQSFAFPVANNPFATEFPEYKTMESVQTSQMSEDFIGVKIGDVNGSAYTNGLIVGQERNAGLLWFDLEDRQVQVDEIFEVKLKADQKVEGYQFTLNTDGLEVLEVFGEGMDAGNFAVFVTDAALTTSWNQQDAVGVDIAEFTLKFRAKRSGSLSKMMNLSSRITKEEAYQRQLDGTINPVPMEIALRFHHLDGIIINNKSFELYQNVPNPFVDKTTIGFYLPEATQATLSILDETGRLLFTQKGDFAKGYNEFVLSHQLLQTSGNLWYKLTTDTNFATKKMIQSK